MFTGDLVLVDGTPIVWAGRTSNWIAACDIDLGEFADLSGSERIVVTVETIYRELDPTRPAADPTAMFHAMGVYYKQKGH